MQNMSTDEKTDRENGKAADKGSGVAKKRPLEPTTCPIGSGGSPAKVFKSDSDHGASKDSYVQLSLSGMILPPL